MSDDKRYLEVVPANIKNDLISLLQSNLSLREKWEVMKARSEAEGNVRMVVADFLISEGLMKLIL